VDKIGNHFWQAIDAYLPSTYRPLAWYNNINYRVSFDRVGNS
jgi:hypothetical protein